MRPLWFSAALTILGVVMIPIWLVGLLVWLIVLTSALATELVCWPVEKLLLKGGA